MAGSDGRVFDQRAFKSYDVRGVYPEQVNEEIAYALGKAYAHLLKPKNVVVGHDVRSSSPTLHRALIEGLTSAGVDVIDIGPISTEMLYFAVAHYGFGGGLVVTASHNLAEYNGFKMVRAGAAPITWETGIRELRDALPHFLSPYGESNRRGNVRQLSIIEDYRRFVLSFIDTEKIKPIRIVANANFGFQGKFAERVLEGLPVEIRLLNGDPDGSFPKGQPDPFLAANRDEFLEKIRAEGPDLGVAWDADADRVFFATGDGVFVEGYYTAALLSEMLLAKHPGESIIYDVRYTWAIEDTVRRCGGEPILSRVGHSYIKEAMRRHNALFCGEASGHIYFRDYFYADSGMLPLLLLLEHIGESGRSFADLIEPFMGRYHVSGEINTRASNAPDVITALESCYAGATHVSRLDGLTLEFSRDWRCNIRTSNTEGLLRLNVEASSNELMQEKRDEILAFIQRHAVID